MSDEMRAFAEQLGEQRGLGREVTPRQRRARPEARAVRQDQRPPLGQRQLMTPGPPGAHDAAVDEQDGGTRARAIDLQIRGREPRSLPAGLRRSHTDALHDADDLERAG